MQYMLTSVDTGAECMLLTTVACGAKPGCRLLVACGGDRVKAVTVRVH